MSDRLVRLRPRFIDIGNYLAAAFTHEGYDGVGRIVGKPPCQHHFVGGRLAGGAERGDSNVGRVHVKSPVKQIEHRPSFTRAWKPRRYHSHVVPRLRLTHEGQWRHRAPLRVAGGVLGDGQVVASAC